jgi:hypothetical protein
MFILQNPVELRNVSTKIFAIISETADTGKYIGHEMFNFSLQLSFKPFFSSDKFILPEDVRRKANTHGNRQDANAPKK